MDFIVTSNALSVEAHLSDLATAMPMVATAMIAASAERIKDDAVSTLQDRTPVGRSASGGHVPGTLRDSTAGTVDIAPDGATVTIDQPAASPQGTHYMQFVAITDWNPAPVRRNYYGNPYPAETMTDLEPELEAHMLDTGAEIMAAIAARWAA